MPRARAAETGRKATSTDCLANLFPATSCDCEGPFAQFLQHPQLFHYRACCQLCPIGLFTLEDLGDFKGHESRDCCSNFRQLRASAHRSRMFWNHSEYNSPASINCNSRALSFGRPVWTVCFEGYSGKMFGHKNSRAYFLYLNFNCCLKRLLH